jgi:glycosyltransferase involved in cell wall biosynthesis
MSQSPELSVVVPVCNEAENVEPLAREIDAALNDRDYEMIFIDDGSTDDTAIILLRLKAQLPRLRVLRHSFRSGQSAAVASGVRAARAPWVATLDGDGQNDPADIPRLLAARDDVENRGVQLFMGNRKASRKDTAFPQAAVEHRQWCAFGFVRRRHAGHRLWDKALFTRGVRRAATFRSHAPLPAGAVHAARGEGCVRACESPAAHARHVQVRDAEPSVGGYRRHRRGHVAAPPLQAGPAGSRRLKGLNP